MTCLNSLNFITFREFLDHKVQFQLILINYLNNLGHLVQSGRSFAALRLLFLTSKSENNPSLSLRQVSKMPRQAQQRSINASSPQNPGWPPCPSLVCTATPLQILSIMQPRNQVSGKGSHLDATRWLFIRNRFTEVQTRM